MKTKNAESLHHWQVGGAEPPLGQYNYRANVMFDVIAVDIIDAIQIVQNQALEGTTIYTVVHKGSVDLITKRSFEKVGQYRTVNKTLDGKLVR